MLRHDRASPAVADLNFMRNSMAGWRNDALPAGLIAHYLTGSRMGQVSRPAFQEPEKCCEPCKPRRVSAEAAGPPAPRATRRTRPPAGFGRRPPRCVQSARLGANALPRITNMRG